MKKTKILLVSAISVICLSLLCSCSDSQPIGPFNGFMLGTASYEVIK